MPEPRALSVAQVRGTVAVRLRPTVDRLRQLASELGQSPYRVFLVHTAWSGGEIGRGTERVLRSVEILPTPRVRAIDSLTGRPTNAGILEDSSVLVDRISAHRYDEDVLAGRDAGGEIPDDTSFFYEIVEDARSTSDPPRRRFRAAGPAGLSRAGISFSVRLERAHEDRTRRGLPGSGASVEVGD